MSGIFLNCGRLAGASSSFISTSFGVVIAVPRTRMSGIGPLTAFPRQKFRMPATRTRILALDQVPGLGALARRHGRYGMSHGKRNPMTPEINPPSSRRKMRALLLGDRIDTSGLERTEVLSTAPLAFRAGKDGVVTVFRYGVVALFGVSPLEEDE